MTGADTTPQGTPAGGSIRADPVKIAVVGGTGARARYGEALAACGELQVTAVVDSDLRAAKACAREWGKGLPVFSDPRELQNAGLQYEAVLAALPLSRRASALYALSPTARCLLCDIPLAETLSGTRAILEAAAQADTQIVPALLRRFDPGLAQMALEVERGQVGAPRQLTIEWRFPATGPLPVESGGVPEDRGWITHLQIAVAHAADVGVRFFGSAVAVNADIDVPVGDLIERTATNEERANIIVTHKTGQTVLRLIRSRARAPYELCVLSCAAGQLELAAGGADLRTKSSVPTLMISLCGAPAQKLTLPAEPPGIDTRSEALLAQFARIVRSQDAHAHNEAQHVLLLQEIFFAALTSTREAGRVALPLSRSLRSSLEKQASEHAGATLL